LNPTLVEEAPPVAVIEAFKVTEVMDKLLGVEVAKVGGVTGTLDVTKV
jgi:hypothetical protein